MKSQIVSIEECYGLMKSLDKIYGYSENRNISLGIYPFRQNGKISLENYHYIYIEAKEINTFIKTVLDLKEDKNNIDQYFGSVVNHENSGLPTNEGFEERGPTWIRFWFKHEPTEIAIMICTVSYDMHYFIEVLSSHLLSEKDGD